MKTRSAPTPVVASDGDARGASSGDHGMPGTTLSGNVRLLVPSGTGDAVSVRVRLDGAVIGTGGPQTGPVPEGSPAAAVPVGGGCGWGWRDTVELTSGVTGLEVRRLGIADEHGVAVGDVSEAVVAQVMPLLRVGPCVDVGAVWLEPVGSGLQVCSPDVELAATLELDEQDDVRPAVDELWAGALDYGAVDDDETAGWFHRE